MTKKDEPPVTNEKSSEVEDVDVVIIVAVPNEKDGVYSAFGLSRTLPRQFGLLNKYLSIVAIGIPKERKVSRLYFTPTFSFSGSHAAAIR